MLVWSLLFNTANNKLSARDTWAAPDICLCLISVPELHLPAAVNQTQTPTCLSSQQKEKAAFLFSPKDLFLLFNDKKKLLTRNNFDCFLSQKCRLPLGVSFPHSASLYLITLSIHSPVHSTFPNAAPPPPLPPLIM